MTSTWVSLEYPYPNTNREQIAINRQHKQLNHADICETVQHNNTWLANFAANFVNFLHHLFFAPHRSPKTSTSLAEHFRTFHPFLYESVNAPVVSFNKTKVGDGSFY